jgi:RNA polymerase sigma-70 factor (ECF subfamily)
MGNEMDNEPDKIRGQDTSRLGVNQKGSFDTTHWSLVIDAAHTDVRVSAAALEALCKRYWYPIYVFIRRKGSARHEAEDHTQAFFAHLLDKDLLKQASPERGRFRTYLLSSLNNFLVNEWEKRSRLKRGADYKFISMDEMQADEMYSREPADPSTPEKLFERRWAMTLISEVLRRLGEDYERQGKSEIFKALEPGLTGESESGWLAGVAERLQISDGSARTQLHRLRRRYGELLREEIGRTLANPADVDDEIRHLFSIVERA